MTRQIILAVYYAIADLVLLVQCFYYRGITWRDDVPPPTPKLHSYNGNGTGGNDRREPNERTALIDSGGYHQFPDIRERRGSDWSASLAHLSPAVPLVDSAAPAPSPSRPPPTGLQSIAFNAVAILMVCAAGVVGWWLSRGSGGDDHAGGRLRSSSAQDGVPAFNTWGQVFGYLCAVLYLGSRLPQMLLNWRRKSTEGVSVLFFLFACLGNLTYGLSIFAFEPECRDPVCGPGEAGRIYGQYILVNLSWLAGSAGTLLLDLGIFVQFFLYNRDDDVSEEDALTEGADERDIDGERWDQRPLLNRENSDY